MKVSGGIKIDIAAADGFTVSLSKAEHTFNYDKNGNLKGLLSDGTISVEVLNGATPLICDSLGVLAPTTDGTYRVTNISISPSATLSYNVDRQNNIFRIIPTQIDAEEVMVTFTIVARTNGVNTTFTRQLKYQKSHDGADAVAPIIIDGFWAFWDDTLQDYVKSSFSAVGDDGHSPYVGANGNWYQWVPESGTYEDTGIKAEGDPGEDGYSVSLSKAEHTFNYDKNGNLKGLLSDGVVSVEVMKGPNTLMCDSLGVLSPTVNDTYRVTAITQNPASTFSYNVDRPNNVFRLTPVDMTVDEVEITFTIVARSDDNNITFTRKIKYQKHRDGADGTNGTDGDSVVHIYKQYPTKPSTPSSGAINPTGWSRNPDYILSIVSQTNWTVNGKWHQSEELTATGNSSTSRITFTTYKDAQTITLELWADGHATYDYVYAGYLDTAVSTSNYYNRVRGGRIIITYDVPTAGNHYIDIFWRKGISTVVGSNRGYYAIISDVKVWRSATNVIGGVPQAWSEPQQFEIDSALEERIYCLSKTTTAPVISDSDAYINDYIPLPCSLSSYRGDFTTYRAYSIGQVVRYQLQYYKVVKAVTSASTRYPTDEEYFEMIAGWTDNPTGANKDFPYEIIAIRKKQSDGLWGPYVTSVWSNYGIGTNYIPMGWWDPSVTYRMTDLGIPLIKKADGTALGYSVYTLKVAASTPGFFFPPEWDLVESADFIYMQQAYIERLQAEIITADRINAMDITSKRVLALDANNNKVASMNEFGDGAYIQYYPSGRKRMEFGGGLIIYYSDDSFNTELWTLGQSGSIHSSSLDRWGEVYFVATDTNGTNVKKQVLPGGVMYKEFKPGSGSVYTSYLGLTVKNTVNSSTTPDNVSSSSYIPTGWYTKPSVAMRNQDDPPYTFRRTLVYFSSGKQTTSKEIVYTDYGDGLPTE